MPFSANSLAQLELMPGPPPTMSAAPWTEGWVSPLSDGLEHSFRDHVVDRIQTGRVDLNENLVRLGHWPRRINERDLIRSAITL
jgi:hypothetical protein